MGTDWHDKIIEIKNVIWDQRLQACEDLLTTNLIERLERVRNWKCIILRVLFTEVCESYSLHGENQQKELQYLDGSDVRLKLPFPNLSNRIRRKLAAEFFMRSSKFRYSLLSSPTSIDKILICQRPSIMVKNNKTIVYHRLDFIKLS